jgi:hypothetical protein
VVHNGPAVSEAARAFRGQIDWVVEDVRARAAMHPGAPRDPVAVRRWRRRCGDRDLARDRRLPRLAAPQRYGYDGRHAVAAEERLIARARHLPASMRERARPLAAPL